VVDRLAPRELLDRLGPNVELVDASRSADSRTLSRAEIEGLLIEHARAGRTVVRLKGGDPFVFAHGHDELRACLDAGVPVEVVPGVSSATSAAALAGVSLTGDGAAGFTVVSGHLAPDDPANPVDWDVLARSGTTLVVLMGMRNLAAIAGRLIDAGIDPDRPARVVADVSLPTQSSVEAPIGSIAEVASTAGLRNPAVVLVRAGERAATTRTLVLGGSGSGKSAFAEQLAARLEPIEYVATGARGGADPEWDERVRRHRERRPANWTTMEATDAAAVLGTDGTAVLLDSVTTWLAAAMDECGCWTGAPGAAGRLDERAGELVEAWTSTRRAVIAVSDEVGSGVVPDTASGRLFRDRLGALNQRLAAASDEVWLVTAGIPRRLR